MFVCESFYLLTDLRRGKGEWVGEKAQSPPTPLLQCIRGVQKPFSRTQTPFAPSATCIQLPPAGRGNQEVSQRSPSRRGSHACWVNRVPPWRLTFCAWLIILRTTSLMCGCPSMGGCM